MVSSDRPVSLEDEVSHSMKEMIGGCCVCSDERGWAENPLVYCDGHGCSVAVHQGKHPTARRAEPGLPTVTASPTLAATASSPPAPPPPRPVPRPGVDSRVGGGAEGVWAVHVGESACGLHCHVILRSLSQVSLGRRLSPEPRFCGLREAGVGSEGVRGAGRAFRGRGCRLGSVEPPPPPAAQSAAVSGDFLCHGVGLRRAALGRVGGRGGCPAALDLGRGGEDAGCRAPQGFWPRPCGRRCGLALPAEKRRKAAAAAVVPSPGAAGPSCAELPGVEAESCRDGRLGPLPQLK